MMSIHRGTQGAHNTLILVLEVRKRHKAYALAEHIRLQRVSIPDIDGAVTSCRNKVVLSVTNHHRLNTTLVRSNRLEEGETGVHSQPQNTSAQHPTL